MTVGSTYGCLTVLDLGEEYIKSEQYLHAQKEHEELQNSLCQYDDITEESEKVKRIREYSTSSFTFDLDKNPSEVDRIFKEFVEHRKYWIRQEISRLQPKLTVHCKCQCKCGKIHYFDVKTIEASPRYCYYPMFISSRMTYSVKSQNATYRKRQEYGDLMNVVFVDSRSDCTPSEEYCGLWNQYKKKQMSKKASAADEKRYTIREWDRSGKKCSNHKVYAVSHLEALKKLYPDDTFELVPQSDIRNHVYLSGRGYDFEVSNHYGNSAQNRTRCYKRVIK